jgi:hypothetical protein
MSPPARYPVGLSHHFAIAYSMAALRRDETGRIHTKNLVIPIAYISSMPRPGVELFASSRIADRYAWLAGL